VAPLDVTFTDNSTGNITNRFWDFGDGSTTNAVTNTVLHTYGVGQYTVKLVVAGPGGSSTNVQLNCIQVVTEFQDWQIENFGSTNSPDAAPGADPDGDGMNNYAEFLANTDPSDAGSALRISKVDHLGNDIRITWNTGPDRTNVLQRATGLLNGFSDIATVVTTGFETNLVDNGAVTNRTASYYRVRLGP
jgi:PKD repeat protein